MPWGALPGFLVWVLVTYVQDTCSPFVAAAAERMIV